MRRYLSNDFNDYLDEGRLTAAQVEVSQIHRDPTEFKDVHARMLTRTRTGTCPCQTQVMTEMVNMIAATRAYEANATALNDAKSMAVKAIEIGR